MSCLGGASCRVARHRATVPRVSVTASGARYGVPRSDTAGFARPRSIAREGGETVAERGFAVAALLEGTQWRIEPLPPAVLADLSVLLSALRSQPPEGG